MTTVSNSPLGKLGIVSTLVDAAMAFGRGQKKDGVLLLIAAALSSRVPGLGTAVSVLRRLVRRVQ